MAAIALQMGTSNIANGYDLTLASTSKAMHTKSLGKRILSTIQTATGTGGKNKKSKGETGAEDERVTLSKSKDKDKNPVEKAKPVVISASRTFVVPTLHRGTMSTSALPRQVPSLDQAVAEQLVPQSSKPSPRVLSKRASISRPRQLTPSSPSLLTSPSRTTRNVSPSRSPSPHALSPTRSIARHPSGSASTSYLPPSPPPVSPRRSSHNRSPTLSRHHPSASTTSLTTSSPYREPIRVASAFLIKELSRPPQDIKGADLEDIEQRLQLLRKAERVWGKSGASSSSTNLATVSGTGESRERKTFHSAIQDGYLLCQLLNKLRPGIIQRPNPRAGVHPKTPNVVKFLEAAAAYGVQSNELFSAPDLQDSSPEAQGRVAATILAISKLTESHPPRPYYRRHPYGGSISAGNLAEMSLSTPNLLWQRPTSPPTLQSRGWSPNVLPPVRPASPGEKTFLPDEELEPPRPRRTSRNSSPSIGFGPSTSSPVLSPPPPRSPLRSPTSQSRTSISSSSTTDVFSSSILDHRSSTRYGTVRTVNTVTTAATSIEAPSLTPGDARNAKAMLATDQVDASRRASGENSRRTSGEISRRVSGETSRRVSGELQRAGERKAPPSLPSKSPSRSPITPLSLSGSTSRSPYPPPRSPPATNTRDPVTSPSPSRSPRPSSRSPQPTTSPTPESTPNTRRRERRTSELGSAANAIDLTTLAEQTEDSAGSASGKDKGDNDPVIHAAPEPPSHPVPTPRRKSSDIQRTAIRLGKGVWPDDFMQAFENANPLVTKSPPIGHSPTNDVSPPSILFPPLKTPKFGEVRSIPPDIDLDLGTPPLSSSPLTSRVLHSHKTSVETIMPGRDQDINPLPDQSRTPSPTATVSPYLSGDAGTMAASSTSLAQPGRRRTSFRLVPKGQTNSSISPASDDRVPYGPISLPSHMKAGVSSPTGGSSFGARVPFPASRSPTPLVPLHLSSELSPENNGVSRMSLSPHAGGKEPNRSISVDSSRPRQNGSRFLSEMRQGTRPISFDGAAQDGVFSARRVRYESMVNLGTANSTSDLTPRDVTGGMYGSAVRYPLVVKQDGESTNYTLGPCIGRGQFGSVYRALNTATGQTVAVKRINLDGLSEEEVTQLMKEVDVLKSLSHPSIVKYEGMVRDHGTLSIVLEYAENGSLGQTLRVYGKLNERLVASYVIKILEGLHYLHEARVVHCDLKAANILTTKNGNIKLSDFGVSLNLRATEQLSNGSMKHEVAGTPNWMAPEVIELKGASTASDIWSLACTIIELLTGKPPYAEISNNMTVMFRIVEDDHPPIPEGIPPIIRDFLMQCFQKDPAKRPTAEMLFEHEWLKQKWGEHKELRPQDSIPFLRRVSADLQKNDSARGLPRLDSTDPTSSLPRAFAGSSDADTSSAGSHSFVQTVFHQPIVCRVCMQQVKVRRKALFCQACTLVAHSRCAADAPPACDIQIQALFMAQSAAANVSVYESHLSTHAPSSPIPIPSPSHTRFMDSPLSSSPASFAKVLAGFKRQKSMSPEPGSSAASISLPSSRAMQEEPTPTTEPSSRPVFKFTRTHNEDTPSRSGAASVSSISNPNSASVRSAAETSSTNENGAEESRKTAPRSDVRHSSRLSSVSARGDHEAASEARLKKRGDRESRSSSRGGCNIQ